MLRVPLLLNSDGGGALKEYVDTVEKNGSLQMIMIMTS